MSILGARAGLVSGVAALALLAAACTPSGTAASSAGAPAVVTGIAVQAVGQVVDTTGFPAIMPVDDVPPAPARPNVLFANGYNEHVAQLLAGHVQAGQQPTLEVVASNNELMGLRVHVHDADGAPVDSYTDWYSLTADAPLDPAEFITPAAQEDLGRPAAVAAAAGTSTVTGVLPVLPRTITHSLSFTPTGDLYWEFVEDGAAQGFSAPAEGRLTTLGTAAAQAAISPANPQVPRPVPDCSAQKCIALTFDDGPSEHTAAVLDSLAAYGSVATFFVNGRNIPGWDAVMTRMRDAGHQIGNHTQDHLSLDKLPPGEVAAQIRATANLLAPYPTAGSPLMRPPYGRYNDEVRAEVARAGYTLVMWDADPIDWDTDDPQVVIDRVLGDARRGSIVLSHDVTASTAVAYQTIIPELIRRGFTLVTVSELLGPTGPGEVHRRG